MIWVGVGTGRCGTQSLAKIFGVRHEAWQPRYAMPALDVEAHWREHKESQVSAFLTWHWEVLREVQPNLHIVCLHRDEESTVQSFLRVNNGVYRGMPWFPDFRVPYDSAEEKWRRYVRALEDVMLQITEPVFHLRTEQLNDDSVLCRLAEWLEIEAFDPAHLPGDRVWDSIGGKERS